MTPMTVVLIADIHPAGDNSLYQEWESRESIEYLRNKILELGYRVEIFEPTGDKGNLLKFLYEKLPRRENVVLWNLVEGYSSRNREAYIPSLAEFLGYPFTGADTYSQIFTLDKSLTKKLARELGILTPLTLELVSPEMDLIPVFPCFCKPRFEGSSLGILSSSILYSEDDLKRHLKEIPDSYYPLLLEEYLPGREFTIGFLGERGKLRPLQLCEVVFDGVYSEAIKSKSLMPEKILPVSDQEYPEIGSGTTGLANAIGVFGFGRADWKLNARGEPVFLEMNLTPGLSPFYSSFPISYMRDYKEMVMEILSIALAEYRSSSRAYGKGGIL